MLSWMQMILYQDELYYDSGGLQQSARNEDERERTSDL